MSTVKEAVNTWADRQGFAPNVEFKGRNSTVGGSRSAPQAGLYVLYFRDDSVYVGESINLRSRMGGHKSKWGADITEVRFKRVAASKQDLLKIEKKYIRDVAKIADAKSRNINHSPTTWAKDVLEEFLSPAEQATWGADPIAFNRSSSQPLKTVPEQQRTKYADAFSKFEARGYADQVVEALRTYLESSVPAPRLTEFHGWSVNVGSTKNGRVICVSVGKMETFVLFHDPQGFRGFVNVRKSVLRSEAGRLYPVNRRWRGRLWPWAGYVDAGGDCARLKARNPDELRRLLADEIVQKASGQLVIDVMRKHPCVYTRYHCPQIVEATYPDQQRDSSAPGPNSSLT